MLLRYLLLLPLIEASELMGPQNGAVRVALVQKDVAKCGDWHQIMSTAAAAAKTGAKFLVFGEACLLGWLNPAAFTQAQTIPGAATARLARIAKNFGLYIAFGMAEVSPDPSKFGPYNSAVLVDPSGNVVLHSRKWQVLGNAFDPAHCPPQFSKACNYTSAPATDYKVTQTPLGKTAVVICADGYVSNPDVLDHLKGLDVEVEAILLVEGITAGKLSDCGSGGFSAGERAQDAAKYTKAVVAGVSGIGQRIYGRFLPSVYCGYSGVADKDGKFIAAAGDASDKLVLADVPRPSF